MLLIASACVGALFVLALIGVMLFVSPDWEVSRTRRIEAPAARIHATVADLNGWPEC